MPTNVRFVLSDDFQNRILSSAKRTRKFYMIVVTDVVNDVTYSRKSVNTRVVKTLFYHMMLSIGKSEVI